MDYGNNYGGGATAGAGGYDNYDNSGGYGGGYGGSGGGYEQQPQQQQPQMGYGMQARPMVNPEATGEVDPNLYPEAQDATHKVRGKFGFIEQFCGPIDQDLLAVKLFYFFFYSAFGSLFPLMGVYFKQMGMNPGQCGILIGMRPFVEFLSAPFWGSYADRWGQGKKLLLASLACWVIFTVPLGFIQPEAVKCIGRNNSDYVITPVRTKRDLSEFDNFVTEGESLKRSRRSLPYVGAGISPINVNFAKNFDPKIHGDYVSPIFSSMVYRTPDIEKAFFLLLLVVLIGEFFSAPAVTLADSAVITLLGDDADKYGQQRMFGSLGWGISMFLVGIALDHSTKFPNRVCATERQEKNYNICFEIFTVLMTLAIISASRIPFKYSDPPQQQMQQENTNPGINPPTNNDDDILAAQLNLPSLASGSKPAFGAKTNPVEQPELGAESKIFASTNREMPEWVTVLSYFKDLKCASFLFVAWFMGFGIGLIFTFLFWHLQDYGGSPTLFGIASVINHISEIFAYFYSFRLISEVGHVKVLCLGLIGNVLRFLYISYLTNPWWVLPFELMQGITHAAVWAACCSYIAHNTPVHLRASSQGVLQGIHHGLGRGCGAVIGGFFVSYYGTTSTFRGYGIMCLIVLGAFIFINFYRKEQGFISEIPTTEDPRQVAEETSHLAPHGVPSNPIPRALSNTRLDTMNGGQNGQGASYGTYQTSAGGNLDIPGANPRNPFAQ